MTSITPLCALAAAFAFALGLPASAQVADATPGNLVVNGSMAFTANGLPLAPGGVYRAGANTSTLAGWAYLDTSLAAEYWVSFGGQPSPDGGQYLGVQDLAAFGPRINVGGITQTLTGLQVGANYDLSFYSMSNHDGGGHQLWSVSFGNTTQDGAATQPNGDDTGNWTLNSMSFTATSAVQALTFMARYLPGSVPEMLDLDGVVLTQEQVTGVPAVPEPSTWTLLGAGLLAGAWATRRRKSSR
jgi:hypothetical protein